MIDASDLTGVDENLARRIIATARSIAPGLDALDNEPRSDAIAILLGVAGEATSRGSRLVKSQNMGPAGVTYRDADSWFSADDRSALRALVAAATGTATGGPLGSFPYPDYRVDHVWRGSRPWGYQESR